MLFGLKVYLRAKIQFLSAQSRELMDIEWAANEN